jgi:hypothetical protein
MSTGYTITLAGQNITQYVDQMSVQIDDTLGQGSGAGSGTSTQGRASTIKFNTSLGPMNTAYGAGQTLPTGGTPVLVRQGEIVVTDSTGTRVFGGYASKFTDTTTAALGNTKQTFTTVEGIDYSTSLQRTLITIETFSGASDVSIISYIMQKYASWVNLQYMPTNPSYTFAIKNFRNTSVEQVLQTVAGITGHFVYVDYYKNLHYIAPTTASSAPYNLSDSPDFVVTFPHAVKEFTIDDTSAINRVYFYGGSKLSNDFTQDLSPLANGHNTVFPLAYYPTHASDGKYHVTVNGVAQNIGSASGTGTANTYVGQGGTANVLMDAGARTLTFDPASPPASGATVYATYRYNHPLNIIITDQNSYSYFGTYLDGSIDDNTVFDITTAVQRCRVLLSQQSLGLVTLKIDTYKAGIQAGMIIHVTNTVRGINGSYLVQEVDTETYGGGNFVFHLTLGAWNWHLIDFLLKLPTLATFQDDHSDNTETVTIEQVLATVQVHDVWSKITRTGPYYARSTPVGDGHDAYPGFSTISS